LSVVRSEKSSLQREQIVAAAVRLADEEGLEALSMRRLAESLGVATMSLYTYVSDKDELLDRMRDHVAAGMLLPEPLPDEWRAGLRAIAVSTRETFEAHPWALETVPRRPRTRLNTMRHVEQSISVVRMLGVDRATGMAVLTSIDDYVIGYCLRKRRRERMAAAIQAEQGGDPGGAAAPELDPEVAAAIEAGELPRLREAFDLPRRRGPISPPDSGFEPGLDWMLDGIEASASG
jgi:AcrR family transcriptional regulator